MSHLTAGVIIPLSGTTVDFIVSRGRATLSVLILIASHGMREIKLLFEWRNTVFVFSWNNILVI